MPDDPTEADTHEIGPMGDPSREMRTYAEAVKQGDVPPDLAGRLEDWADWVEAAVTTRNRLRDVDDQLDAIDAKISNIAGTVKLLVEGIEREALTEPCPVCGAPRWTHCNESGPAAKRLEASGGEAIHLARVLAARSGDDENLEVPP